MPSTPEPLDALRAKFDTLVRPFDVHPTYKRFSTSPTDDGGPHIEHYGQTYAYVVTERGAENERRETRDPEDVLYWLVSDTTGEAAQNFELAHRIPGKDVRRLLFAKHVEFLERVRADWGNRKRAEYESILKKYPYHDAG